MMRFCLILLAAAVTSAQTFEVASVKPSALQNGARPQATIKGGPGTADPGQITWINIPMRAVLLRAYELRNYQLSAPKWVDTERYDIVAKIAAGSTQDEARAMLRNLLKDRFKMAEHEETREGPVYALVTGKSGSKLKESAAPAAVPETPGAPQPDGGPPLKLTDGFPTLPPGRPGMTAIMLNGSIRLTAQMQRMGALANTLSMQLDREVADLTELKGLYDFHLSYTPESVLAVLPAGPDGTRPDTLGTDVFTALGEQLGLKLECRKGPVRTVFVDTMEKTPAER